MPSGSRLPELGPRGEGWVVLQLLLGGAIAGSGFVGVYWPGSVESFFGVLGLLIACRCSAGPRADRAARRALRPQGAARGGVAYRALPRIRGLPGPHAAAVCALALLSLAPLSCAQPGAQGWAPLRLRSAR